MPRANGGGSIRKRCVTHRCRRATLTRRQRRCVRMRRCLTPGGWAPATRTTTTHHEARSFPVYRIRYEDGERMYVDRVSGELAFAVDRERRWWRWVFHALHRGDFSAVVRARPVWDLMMWLLLLGVTAGNGHRDVDGRATNRSLVRQAAAASLQCHAGHRRGTLSRRVGASPGCPRRGRGETRAQGLSCAPVPARRHRRTARCCRACR